MPFFLKGYSTNYSFKCQELRRWRFWNVSNKLVLLYQELYTQSFSVKTHPCLFKFKLPLMKNENFLYITNLVLSLTKWRCSFWFYSYSLDSRKIKVLSRGWWHKPGEDFLKLSVSMTWEMPQYLSELAAFLENPDWISQPSIIPVLGFWRHQVYKQCIQIHSGRRLMHIKYEVVFFKKLKSRAMH